MAKKPRKTKPVVPPDASPVVEVSKSRHIGQMTHILLAVRAGGRCEFDGCNDYLFEHHLTFTTGNYAERAHIVAFSPDGPRGDEKLRPVDINNVDNLMLLCPTCHKLIDDHPSEYSVRVLKEHKKKHEDRIYYLTGLRPERRTLVVKFQANIGDQRVEIPFGQIVEAVSPNYPVDRKGCVIDLTELHGDDRAFFKAATTKIDREVGRLYDSCADGTRTGHLSLFALGPIPLLVYLGRVLSNKITVDYFQRHRDTENWTWKTSGAPAQFTTRRRRQGSNNQKVALLVSLSGKINVNELPEKIDGQYTVYEIMPKDIEPNPTFLRRREDLNNFREVYLRCLGNIRRIHGLVKEIHLFPAVPAPVAVMCGREMLPKVMPSLLVYDFNKAQGGYNYKLKVN